MTIKNFASMAAFEIAMEDTTAQDETIHIIRDNDWILTDMMTVCKTWKTALNRFFRAMSDIPEVADWRESLIASCECGYPNCNDSMMADGTCNQMPCFAHGVEQLDNGLWYVFLNVRRAES